MTRECVTHHHACDCREAEFAELQSTVSVQQDTIGALKRKLSLAEAERDALRQRIESAPVVQCQKVRVAEGHATQTAVLEYTHERIPGGANSWIGKRVCLVVENGE